MEKEEITTNDYLKGIVLNLPDSPVHAHGNDW